MVSWLRSPCNAYTRRLTRARSRSHKQRSRTRRKRSCESPTPAAMLLKRMSTLVQSVPNFSEGRDKAKVDAIVAAMKMAGVYWLGREMGADHHRCVIALAGGRGPIQDQV